MTLQFWLSGTLWLEKDYLWNLITNIVAGQRIFSNVSLYFWFLPTYLLPVLNYTFSLEAISCIFKYGFIYADILDKCEIFYCFLLLRHIFFYTLTYFKENSERNGKSDSLMLDFDVSINIDIFIRTSKPKLPNDFSSTYSY